MIKFTFRNNLSFLFCSNKIEIFLLNLRCVGNIVIEYRVALFVLLKARVTDRLVASKQVGGRLRARDGDNGNSNNGEGLYLCPLTRLCMHEEMAIQETTKAMSLSSRIFILFSAIIFVLFSFGSIYSHPHNKNL